MVLMYYFSSVRGRSIAGDGGRARDGVEKVKNKVPSRAER